MPNTIKSFRQETRDKRVNVVCYNTGELEISLSSLVNGNYEHETMVFLRPTQIEQIKNLQEVVDSAVNIASTLSAGLDKEQTKELKRRQKVRKIASGEYSTANFRWKKDTSCSVHFWTLFPYDNPDDETPAYSSREAKEIAQKMEEIKYREELSA